MFHSLNLISTPLAQTCQSSCIATESLSHQFPTRPVEFPASPVPRLSPADVAESSSPVCSQFRQSAKRLPPSHVHSREQLRLSTSSRSRPPPRTSSKRVSSGFKTSAGTLRRFRPSDASGPRRTRRVVRGEIRDQPTQLSDGPLSIPLIEGSLFAAIATRSSTSSLNSDVSRFLQRCEKDADKGMAELVGLVGTACYGAGDVVTPEKINQNPVAVIEELSKTIPQLAGRYLLISAEKQWKPFQKRFPEFWYLLITQAKRRILWEPAFTDALLKWMLALTQCTVRGIRHTCTVATYAILDGLVDVAVSTESELQALSALAKTSPQSPTTIIDQQNRKIRDLIRDWMDRIFVHRWRDVFPTLRILSMQKLGRWAQKLPAVFVKDHFMKYLGWGLSDTDATVREATLLSLQRIFQPPGGEAEALSPTLVPQMTHFMEKFGPRLIQLTADVKSSVAVEAMKLLGLIYAVDIDNTLLKPADVQKLLEKITNSWANIRVEAAKFLRRFLRRVHPCADDAGNDEVRRVNHRRLKTVLEFLDCFPPYEMLAAYLVDSAWDIGIGFLFDYDQLFEELMDQIDAQPASNASPPASMVAHMFGLIHSVMLKLRNQLKLVSGRGLKEDLMTQAPKPGRPRLNAIQTQEAVQTISEHLMSHFGKLASVFHKDVLQMQRLLEMVRLMDFTVFNSQRQQAEDLVDYLVTLFLSNATPLSVQHSVALALDAMTASGMSSDAPSSQPQLEFPSSQPPLLDSIVIISTIAHKKAIALVKQLTVALAQAQRRLQTAPANVDDEGAAQAYTETWLRISMAYSMHAVDVNSKAWGLILETLQLFTSINEEVNLALKASIGNALPSISTAVIQGLLLKVSATCESNDSNCMSDRSATERLRLREDIDLLIDRLMSILRTSNDQLDVPISNMVRGRVLVAICEMFFILQPRSATANMRAILPPLLQISPSENDMHLLLAQWQRLRSNPDFASLRGVLLDAAMALGRIIRPSSTASIRFLSLATDPDPEISQVLRLQRKAWRLADPSTFWKCEWHALLLQFTRFVDATGPADRKLAEWNAFLQLVIVLVSDHTAMTAIAYRKARLNGSAFQLLSSAFRYAMDDIAHRFQVLIGLLPFCEKLLSASEAVALTSVCKTALVNQDGASTAAFVTRSSQQFSQAGGPLGPRQRSAIERFMLALQSAASVSSSASENEEIHAHDGASALEASTAAMDMESTRSASESTPRRDDLRRSTRFIPPPEDRSAELSDEC